MRTRTASSESGASPTASSARCATAAISSSRWSVARSPAIGQIGGHGIWLVNLVCDLVQVRSSEDGSTVRMKMGPS